MRSSFRHRGFSVLTLLMLTTVIAGGLAYMLLAAGPNVDGMLKSQKAAQLASQAQFIVHRVVKCATDYPQANNGMASHKAYPLDANPGSVNASTLVCPGNGQNLWSGTDGVYFPVGIAGFGNWAYTLSSPVTLSISATSPGTHAAAMADAASRIGTTASVAADTLIVKVIE
jgi:hypothetical protein